LFEKKKKKKKKKKKREVNLFALLFFGIYFIFYGLGIKVVLIIVWQCRRPKQRL